MKITYLLFLFPMAVWADYPVDDYHCDIKSHQCEHRTLMMHEKPMSQAEAVAAEAKSKQAEQDKATAKANARAHVTDCSSGKLTGDACSGAALAKDIAALIPADDAN